MCHALSFLWAPSWVSFPNFGMYLPHTGIYKSQIYLSNTTFFQSHWYFILEFFLFTLPPRPDCVNHYTLLLWRAHFFCTHDEIETSWKQKLYLLTTFPPTQASLPLLAQGLAYVIICHMSSQKSPRVLREPRLFSQRDHTHYAIGSGMEPVPTPY